MKFASPYLLPSLVAALSMGMAPLCALPALADEPPAMTSIWGYSGLVVMPTAAVHGFRDFSVGFNLLTKNAFTPQNAFAGVPYVSAGIFEGLEAGIVYGIPLTGFTGLSGHAKYQLVRPTRERPTAVAVGLSMVGVGGTERYIDGNNLYLVLSQDINTNIGGRPFTLLAAHFGFSGNLTGGARIMGGADLPLGDKASLVGDYLGPVGAQGGFFNVALAFRPFKEWQLRAYSMGVPGGAWTDRDYGLGLSFTGNILGNPVGVGASPTARPTPAPKAVASPKPTPLAVRTPEALVSVAPTPEVTIPTAVPSGVASETPDPNNDPSLPAPLRGALIDDKNRPLAGWKVGIVTTDQWVTTDLAGRYRFELPQGPYEVQVRDPQGNTMLSKNLRLVTSKGMELPLVVTVPTGELKGMVIDRQTKQGLGDATIRVFRSGDSYNLNNRDNGAFYMADLQTGDYKVVVTRPRYKPFETAITVVAKREVSVLATLDPKPGSLAGKVTSLKGQGQPGVAVAIPSLKLETATDRQGAYVFPDLPPGQHQVLFTQASKRIATTSVRVRSDETTTENVTTTPAEAIANRAGTISGQVLDATTKRPLGGVKIAVEAKDLTVLTLTGSDGRFSVADLPPGKYKLTGAKPGFVSKQTSATVSTKTGATINLSLTPGK